LGWFRSRTAALGTEGLAEWLSFSGSSDACAREFHEPESSVHWSADEARATLKRMDTPQEPEPNTEATVGKAVEAIAEVLQEKEDL
jgi:hypothetical protein